MSSSHSQLLKDILGAPPRRSDARDVLGGLVYRAPEGSWKDFVAGIEPARVDTTWSNAIVGPLNKGGVAGWQALHAGLVSASAVIQIDDIAVFQRWAPRVARFSFVLPRYEAS